MIGYSRAEALPERAVLPVTFGALDGEVSWRDETKTELGPHRLARSHPDEITWPALLTALRTGFADSLLREAVRGARLRAVLIKLSDRLRDGSDPAIISRIAGKIVGTTLDTLITLSALLEIKVATVSGSAGRWLTPRTRR